MNETEGCQERPVDFFTQGGEALIKDKFTQSFPKGGERTS
jgi:hypothetical protein